MAIPKQADHSLAARQARVLYDSTSMHGGDPHERIALIRQGIPAAAISRKEKDAGLLSKDESERVLGVETLIAMVQAMVERSGDPAGFDAARWAADWLSKPLPALAGATPASYMDTFEGQNMIRELLAMSESGAYA